MEIFNDDFKDLLLRLLRIPTVSPFDINTYDPRLTKNRDALDTLIEFARECGQKYGQESGQGVDQRVELIQEYYEAPPEAYFYGVVHKGRTIKAPSHVTRLYHDYPGIRDAQPSLVLKAGRQPDSGKTICFNAHIDTVAGLPPSEFKDGTFYGRGAVDMKGPLVATLAGIVHSIHREPDLLKDIAIRLQVVSGEEGGPIGMIGTAVLVKNGYTGRLNIFCEPTNGGRLNAGLTNMTSMLTTKGNDAHESKADHGFTARHLLGHLDRCLEKKFIPSVLNAEGTVCLAGMQTEGRNHSRVYGTAFSKINIGYPSEDAGDRFKRLFETEIAKGISEYEATYRAHPLFGATAKQAGDATKLEWLKSGYPVFNNSDAQIDHTVLRDIPTAADRGVIPFACDAIWGPPYTIVLGPGDLGMNYSHDDREFIRRDTLEDHAKTVSLLIKRFRNSVLL